MWTLAISCWCVSSAFQAAEEVKVLMEIPFVSGASQSSGLRQKLLAIVHNHISTHYNSCVVRFVQRRQWPVISLYGSGPKRHDPLRFDGEHDAHFSGTDRG